ETVTVAIATGLESGPQLLHDAWPSKNGHAHVLKPAKPRIALVTTTAAALAQQEFPPVKFVVEKYVAEGLTVIAGRPKTGKSLACARLGCFRCIGRCGVWVDPGRCRGCAVPCLGR